VAGVNVLNENDKPRDLELRFKSNKSIGLGFVFYSSGGFVVFLGA
jgi:hypothetical protein